MRKVVLAAVAAALLAGCSYNVEELDSLQQAEETTVDDGAVNFSVYTNRSTRAGAPGTITATGTGGTTSLATEGFSVFGYYTGAALFDEQFSTPNFMYNQRVTSADGTKWTYNPVKYWPNETLGEAGGIETDHVSLFAYAPWVEVNPANGVPTSNPDKNIILVNHHQKEGDPYVYYKVDNDPATSVDLLWGVSSDATFTGWATAAGTIAKSAPYVDLTRQNSSTGTVKWNFNHALARLNVQIVAASDVSTTSFAPSGMSTIPTDGDTKIYLRWIEFTGFAMRGALNLHSVVPSNPADLKPLWLDISGVKQLKRDEPVRFLDGLLDTSEGYDNNTDPNEQQVGLNAVLIEEPTGTGTWQQKKPGIPTDDYVNLFNSSVASTPATQPIFVVPTDKEMNITICYDVETADQNLSKFLSDGKTHGKCVKVELSEATGLKIEAGKSYTVKIIVGMTSIKVDAEVTPWTEGTAASNNESVVFSTFKMGDASIKVLSSGTQVYDGTEKKPFSLVFVAGKNNEIEMVEGKDYTIKYENNIDAGTATATITGKGDYSGTQKLTFTIEKAYPKVLVSPLSITYDAAEHDLITSGSTTPGKLEYSLDQTTWTTTSPKATNAGTYPVYYRVSYDSEDIAKNYHEVTLVKPATIAKAPAALSITSPLATSFTLNPTTTSQTLTFSFTGGTLTATPAAALTGKVTPSYTNRTSTGHTTTAGTCTVNRSVNEKFLGTVSFTITPDANHYVPAGLPASRTFVGGVELANSAVGDRLCYDGYAYPPEATSVTPLGMVAYKSGTSGLCIARKNATEYAGAGTGDYKINGGCTSTGEWNFDSSMSPTTAWRLPEQSQINNIFSACGGYAGLQTKLQAAGCVKTTTTNAGTALSSEYYYFTRTSSGGSNVYAFCATDGLWTTIPSAHGHFSRAVMVFPTTSVLYK